MQNATQILSRRYIPVSHGTLPRRLNRTPGPAQQYGQVFHRPSRASISARAATDTDKDLLVDDNVLEFCSLDEGGRKPLSKKSLGELENDFLTALTSFYFEGKAGMSNEEFDLLKEELQWQGSKVVILSSAEQRFLEASLAYNAKKPIMSDEDYDKLKGQLRRQNSFVATQGPRCSIRSRSLYSDAKPDYLRMTALYLPATIVTLLGLFSIDDLTGFELTKLLELPEPFGVIFLWGICLPLLFLIVNTLTQFFTKDGLILEGPCPNCNTVTRTYFGDIFTITGNRDKNMVVCSNCKAKLSIDNNTRVVKVEEMPGEGKKPAPSKKPAAA